MAEILSILRGLPIAICVMLPDRSDVANVCGNVIAGAGIYREIFVATIMYDEFACDYCVCVYIVPIILLIST